MKNRRVTITHVNPEGLRVMTLRNVASNLWDSSREANQYLMALKNSNTKKDIEQVYGPHFWDTVRTELVDCHPSGEAVYAIMPTTDYCVRIRSVETREVWVAGYQADHVVRWAEQNAHTDLGEVVDADREVVSVIASPVKMDGCSHVFLSATGKELK